jgi:hypothetical protein
MHPGVMEKQLRDKAALRCSANSLFNEAAEKALKRTPAG